MNEGTREDARRAVREAVTRHALAESQAWVQGSGEWRQMVSEEYNALARDLQRIETMRPLLDNLAAQYRPGAVTIFKAESMAVAEVVHAWRADQ